jgi:uncharacterized protein YbgA (DUF1722 family)/uncharacterized protein YbbK (DUF523 family)
LLISRCFFEEVRYDGGKIVDPLVEKLKPFIEAIPFCPEAEFGLGIPRPKIRVLKKYNQRIIWQEDTRRDLTFEMRNFFIQYLASLSQIDGALLKSKSPSCGVGTATLYEDDKKVGKTDGLFAHIFKKVFPDLPLEDEGRLRDKSLYYNFLTRIFILSRFRVEVKIENPKSLLDFHTRAKFLLITYHEELTKEMGRLLARAESEEGKFLHYETLLKEALKKRPDRKKHANTLYHLAGYFTKRISPKERHHLIHLIEKFRLGKVDLHVPLELIKSFALRFDENYILSQIYLEPFPAELY